MRITLFFLLVSILQTFATDGYSQKTRLSIDLSDTKLIDVFDEIEEQSEFYFLYNEKLVNTHRRVSLSLENEQIDEILRDLFEGTDVVFTISDRKIILAPDYLTENVPQDRIISGQVTDKEGFPLPGVTVLIMGSSNGTVTGSDGNYNISNVPEGATLQFSFIGMKTVNIQINGKSTLNVTMENDAIGLEEVVAVGYGFKKKVNLTGAVASMGNEVLEKIPTVGSTTNALAGRMPGLLSKQSSGSPGRDGAQLSIRGFGAALVIVDGVEGDFNNIDPTEIESISVLKDASAAIYGARAGNGVILVTTKRGKSGKPTISVNSSFTLQNITNYPEPMSAGQYAEASREFNINRGKTESQQTYSEEEVQKFYNGTDPDYPNTNWKDVLIRDNAPMHQHNISIRGGSEKVRFFGLLGYMKQETFWKNDGGDFQRINMRANMDADITDNLSVQIDFSNINEKRHFPARDGNGNDKALWQDYWWSAPVYPSSLPDPTKLPYAGSDANGSAYITSNIGISGFADNLVQTIKTAGTLSYKIPYIEGLTAKYRIDYLKIFDEKKVMNKPVDFWLYNHASDIYTLKGTWSPEANLRHNNSKNQVITNQLSFNYEKVFNNDHNLSVLALYELIDYSSEYIQAERYHFLTPSVEYLFGGSTTDQYAFGEPSEMGRASYVGRVNYSYKSKYLLETTLRADASAKFPSDKRWGYFPSFSFGWRVSEENFIKENVGWIENLKLRGGISNTGYDEVGNFAYLSGYKFGRSYIIGGSPKTGLVAAGLANPNLTWEEISTYNFGFDFSSANSTIYCEGDVFYRTRDGIPATRQLSLPSTFGETLPPENLNSTNNRGFEFSIGTRGNSGDLTWDISANISWAREKWDHFEEPDYSNDPDGYRVLRKSGQWVDRTIGYKTDGLYTSQEEIDAMTFVQDNRGNETIKPGDIKYIDVNGDKILNWKDQVDIGKGTIPNWMFGFVTNLTYKNFDLSALFQGAAGHYSIINVPNTIEWFNGRWSPTNNDPNALFKRHGSQAKGGGFSDFNFKKAGYLRLKTFNLGYNVPKDVLKIANIETLRIYFAGTNLFTVDKLGEFGMDPEAPSAELGNAVKTFYYPQQRTFTFGLNLTL